MTYIEPPIEIDPTVLLQRFYDYMAANVPGWKPSPAQLDVWLGQAFVLACIEARMTASAMPTSLFRFYGRLAGVIPTEATSAIGRVKFTAIDNKGYTIPAGTQIGIYTDTISYLPFQTVSDAVILVGQTVVDQVQVVAMTPGAASSALGGLNVAAVLLDTRDYIVSVMLDGPTSGGVDAETDEQYLDELSEELTLLGPKPILPNDVAILARKFPGVGRATAIDMYDPVTNSYNVERYVTVAVADDDGLPLDVTVRNALYASLDAIREINFVIPVISPTYTTVQVNYQVKSKPNFNSVDVKASVDEALGAYLNRATWGTTEPDAGNNWANQAVVRYSKVQSVVDRVAGVDFIEALSIGIPPGAQGNIDVNLAGPAPLPDLAILGTAD